MGNLTVKQIDNARPKDKANRYTGNKTATNPSAKPRRARAANTGAMFRAEPGDSM